MVTSTELGILVLNEKIILSPAFEIDAAVMIYCSFLIILADTEAISSTSNIPISDIYINPYDVFVPVNCTFLLILEVSGRLNGKKK